LSDHLGSLTELVDSSGGVVQRLRYMAWGEDRYEQGAGLTDNRYTGQHPHQSGQPHIGPLDEKLEAA